MKSDINNLPGRTLQLVLATVLLLCATVFASSVYAQSGLSGLLGGGGDSEILSPDEAFEFEIVSAGDNLGSATFLIRDGYYLYRDKIGFTMADNADVEISVNDLTKGKLKHDEFFGEVEVNRKIASAELGFKHTGAAREVAIDVAYQGCADIGICYPPQTKRVNFMLAAGSAVATGSGGSSGGNPLNALSSNASSAASTTAVATADAATVQALELSEQDRLAARLGESSLPVIIALFVGLGVLLAFTPCVLPMVPILSGLIVGQGENITPLRATLLSIVYVLAMALTYAVAGVLVASTGAGTGFLQNPWVLSAFAALLVLLSLSMFGFYELQMPLALQNRLNSFSSNQNGGTFAGAGIMGFLSALIVGPCVTAPLVGALIFIADTGNAMVGGTALFALGIGMGIPLILVGASCGKWLPKAGVWMERVKAFFGVMLIGLAIWMLSRFLPAAVTMALAAALVIVSGIYLGALDSLQADAAGWRRLAKGGGVIALVYGAALLVGALSGGHSMLTPLKGVTALGGSNTAASNQGTGSATQGEAEFVAIKSLDDLNGFVKTAGTNNQPVILDFYADWCVSCKEMEAFTFTDPAVREQMEKSLLLQADVTKNDNIDKALLKEFGLFGPPAILFFSPNGDEVRNGRVVGFMNKEDFHQHLVNVYGNMGIATRTASR